MKLTKDIMNPFPVTIESGSSLRTTLEKFSDTGLSHLVAIDSSGNYQGIISKEDILTRTNWIMRSTSGKTFTDLELDNTKAKEFMTMKTLNLKIDDSIEYATELLLQGKFHSLPVIDNGKAVGIITSYDLIKLYYEATTFATTVNNE